MKIAVTLEFDVELSGLKTETMTRDLTEMYVSGTVAKHIEGMVVKPFSDEEKGTITIKKLNAKTKGK